MPTQDLKQSTIATPLQAKTPAESPTKIPLNVSLDKWADTGFEWSGSVEPSEFTRLEAILTDEHEQAPIEIAATLSKSNNVLNLSFTLKGDIWLTCQRCLQPIAVDLTGEHDIALLADESQARLLSEEDEYLLLEEIVDPDAQEKLLPLARLIEDEILLETPLSPKHDDCEMVVDQVGEIEEEAEESPFAALAALKGKLS